MAFEFIKLGDIDGLSHSLNTLKKLDFFGVKEEDIEAAADEILQIQQ
jgi:hypothetical protein